MKDVVIVSACRTAIGTFGGSLRDLNCAGIGSVVMREAVKRAGIEPGMIDDVRFGCCMEPVDALNVTRISALLAGIPETVTAATVNRVCISGMEAVVSGMAMIQAGMADVILAGGMEHMSGAAYSVPGARWGCRFQDQVFVDNIVHGLHAGSHLLPGLEQGPVKEGGVIELFRGKPYIMGVTAELIAQMHNLSREEIDEVALRSHNNAERATKEGDFREEIVPVEIPQKKGKPPVIFERDEHFRPGLTKADLAALPAAFVPKSGKVTAGNSSGVNDGASAMVIMSAEKAAGLGLKPLARIKGYAAGGVDPAYMGLGPIPAVQRVLHATGVALSDVGRIELNEAFASQAIACIRELKLDMEKTNVYGSAISLGHPIGCSGARLLVTLVHELQRKKLSLGLASLCIGGGQGMAMLVEAL
jgi:acetyl-CoA C-acetyltransferase